MNSKTKGNFLILLTAFLWSFLGVAAKRATTDGILITGVTGLAALIVIRLCYIRHKLRINKITVLTGLITTGVNLTFFLANKYTTVTNTIVLQYSSPIFVLILSILLLHYKPSKKQLTALTVCMAGMIIFFSDQFSSGNMLGNILALTSGVLFAGSFFLNAMPENDPISSMMINYFFCVCIAVCYALLSGNRPVESDMGLLIFTGIFFSGFSAIFYSKGIQLTTALNANLLALSEVFMAPVWAYFFFHEKMGKFSLIGMILMICSIIYESYLESVNQKKSII